MVTPAFATRSDLEVTLKRTFAAPDQPWVDDLLAQASDHLRSEVLGWQVYPVASVTYKTRLQAGQFFSLPMQPASLVSVAYSDSAVQPSSAPEVYNGGFVPTVSGVATLVLSVGYSVAPPVLRSWCMTLAAQAIAHLEKLGTLTADAYSSVAIDDFRLVWNQNGQSGWGIPEMTREVLRNQFQSSAYTTGG
jgi:hypothetical protein